MISQAYREFALRHHINECLWATNYRLARAFDHYSLPVIQDTLVLSLEQIKLCLQTENMGHVTFLFNGLEELEKKAYAVIGEHKLDDVAFVRRLSADYFCRLTRTTLYQGLLEKLRGRSMLEQENIIKDLLTKLELSGDHSALISFIENEEISVMEIAAFSHFLGRTLSFSLTPR